MIEREYSRLLHYMLADKSQYEQFLASIQNIQLLQKVINTKTILQKFMARTARKRKV